VPFFSKISSERSDRSDVDGWRLAIVLAMIDLGEMPNPNPLLWSKFHGSKYQIRTGYVGVITEFNLAHVLKRHQIVQSLFNAILGPFTGLNKLSRCGQSYRGLPHLSFDTKITLIVSVFWKI